MITWNGTTATREQLALLAHHTYGCYTFFQVRQHAVRGLALHLDRLTSDGTELFGAAPASELVQELVAAAVSQAACSVRVTLVASDVSALLAGETVRPDVVVSVSPAKDSSVEPLDVRSVAYERETPHLKHRATHGLVRQTRAARQAGYDDALLVNRAGHISEGSTWNLGLHDGEQWVWPQAPALPGVTLRLLQKAMAAQAVPAVTRPVTVPEAEQMVAAFALNATSPARPIARLNGHRYRPETSTAVLLEDLWGSVEPEPLDG